MKKTIASLILGIAITNTIAQAQTVTIAVGGNLNSESFPLATNQILKIVSVTGNSPPYVSGFPSIALNDINGVTVTTTNTGTFTGLTNFTVNAAGSFPNYITGMVTFEVSTPVIQGVVSNYIPADAIVIPASAGGNVQIILESSPDLVNWTAANPGIYGASAGTNRFFRVRAQGL